MPLSQVPNAATVALLRSKCARGEKGAKSREWMEEKWKNAYQA